MELSNKVAIVTGGSSGLGKAIAILFAKEGAKVVIASLDKEKGETVATEIGNNVEFVATDVTIEADIEKLVDATVAKHGQIDIVVSSAGIYFRGQESLETVALTDVQKIFAVNFNGTFLMTKHTIPYLLKTKGTVINISSSLGVVPEGESNIYCATKAAVNMFTRSTAVLYADRGVRVNAISPGPIDTPMLHDNIPDSEEMESYIDSIPMKRAGTAEDVAEVALFLASNKSGYVTGSIYAVDGGESLK